MQKKLSKTLSIILVLTLVLSSLVPAFATLNAGVYSVNDVDYDLQIGVHEYHDYRTGSVCKLPYYYSDGYFFDNPYSYDYHLATLSTFLMIDLMSGNDDYANVLLEDIGFTNLDPNEYIASGTNGKNTIGYTFAKKQLETSERSTGKTLVLVAIRGAGYGNEWYNNFIIGESGESKGFADSATAVLEGLNSYLTEQSLVSEKEAGNLVFWVCSYSRGAAVGNVAAKRMIDNICAGTNNRLYCYTGGTPIAGIESAKVSANAEAYKAIHSIVNYDDFVTHAAPSGYGFIRYGQDHEIKSIIGTDEYKKYYALVSSGRDPEVVFNGAYLSINLSDLFVKFVRGDDITYDDIISKYSGSLSIGQFMDDIFKDMTGKWFSNRKDNYVNRTFNGGYTFEKAVATMINMSMQMSSEQMEQLSLLFKDTESELIALFDGMIAWDFPEWNYKYKLTGWDKVPSSKKKDDIEDIWNFINNRNVNGVTVRSILGEADYAEFSSSFYSLADGVISMASYDYNKDYVHSNGPTGNKMYIICTLANNVYLNNSSITEYHYPEHYAAAVLSEDSFYDNYLESFSDASTYTTASNDDIVVVAQYDENGKYLGTSESALKDSQMPDADTWALYVLDKQTYVNKYYIKYKSNETK